MSSPGSSSEQAFDSLDAMMCASAEEAVRLAADDHGMVHAMALDYTPESIPRLEAVLAARSPVPQAEQERATRLWGAYYGEIFRRRYSGDWIMAVYPTPPGTRQQEADQQNAVTDMAMPALDIGGSHIYPLLKIFRRITLGPAEDLAAFYAKVSSALDARSS